MQIEIERLRKSHDDMKNEITATTRHKAEKMQAAAAAKANRNNRVKEVVAEGVAGAVEEQAGHFSNKEISCCRFCFENE